MRTCEDGCNGCDDCTDYDDEDSHPGYLCRHDGRCQYAIDCDAEELGHCPRGKCVMPDIDALKKRLAEDPAFAAQVIGDRPSTPIGWSDTDWLAHLEKKAAPLRRGVDGVCIRSVCECEREGLGDQCIYLRPKDYPAYAKGPLPETGWD